MLRDWFWEGNVQATLARSLRGRGWSIQSTANTATKAHGVDLVAGMKERILAVEVKGYPSTGYADPRRSHERKRTNPVTQAAHWFGQALLKGMRLRSSMPHAEIALAFPDFPRYRALLSETEDSLRRLGIGVYLVAESGEVERLLPHSSEDRVLDESLLPFDGYEGDGRRLLGIPPLGGGSSRRDYGIPVFEQCGWACAYCGVDLSETYESWLGLSVEHVVPRNLVAVGYPSEWIEDLVNQVTCCRHCNEFLNQYRIAAPPPTTVDEFFDLRDQVFREKRRRALDRHRVERGWFQEHPMARAGRRAATSLTQANAIPTVITPDLIEAIRAQHTGKYRSLWEWLRSRSDSEITLTFAQIEEVLGFVLPPSSRHHAAHWVSYQGSAVARAILDAGWKASRVDLSGEKVVLSRLS
jgi:Holliday junction resolvase-like predicted endonuclease